MILMNDFQREDGHLIDAQILAASRVIRSGWFILGTEVEAFEKEWATYTGSIHAIGVANGMDAIEIGLRSLGIGANDEVITTPMTAFATVLAVFRAGATPVLADINPNTGMIDSESVRRCINSKTKLVLPVHLFGSPAPILELQEICKANGIFLGEDCAQAHGASIENIKLGNFGQFAAWSFYPTKNLGAPGDGGCITTNDPQIAELARCLRNYGQKERYFHSFLGLNSRLDEIHAAILREKLKVLDRQNERRGEIALQYRNRINNVKIKLLQKLPDNSKSVYHLFPVLCEDRSSLMEHLKSSGVQSLIHYPVPIQGQNACRDIKRDPQGLANSEYFANRVCSIPIHPYLTDTEVNVIIQALNRF